MPSPPSYIMINFKDRVIEMLLSVRIYRQKSWYFAECPELELVDQGKSKKEAVLSLQQMISISLIEAFETGNLAEMLKELGFKENKVPVPTLRIYANTSIKAANLTPLPFNTRIPFNIECPSLEYTSVLA